MPKTGAEKASVFLCLLLSHALLSGQSKPMIGQQHPGR